jgi:hypothetical protein
VASEAAVNAARAEIRAQRDRIAALMGQIRDLVHGWPRDSVQRITTENTTLKQRVRHLTQENRVPEERLQAARSTCRFAASPGSKPRSPGMPGSHEAGQGYGYPVLV